MAPWDSPRSHRFILTDPGSVCYIGGMGNVLDNPFRAAVQAKRTLTALYPTVQAQIVLGPSGPFLEVQPVQVSLPQKINGFKVVSL